LLHASPIDLTRVRCLLPGTIVYFRWPNGEIQEAMRSQDLYELPSAGFIFFDALPDTTVLEDVPVIVVDENQKWHLV
jgi:hypothetical protein